MVNEFSFKKQKPLISNNLLVIFNINGTLSLEES